MKMLCNSIQYFDDGSLKYWTYNFYTVGVPIPNGTMFQSSLNLTLPEKADYQAGKEYEVEIT